MSGRNLAKIRTLLMALAPLLASSSIWAADAAFSPAQLPAIALRANEGQPATLSGWADKPLVLNVWATWCPPCRKEMPALQSLSDAVAMHGIRVVLLSVDQDMNLMEEFLLKYGITLPSPVAVSANDVYRDLDAVALPVTFYVQAGGRIVGKQIGARHWDDPATIAEVIATLAPQHSARQAKEASP